MNLVDANVLLHAVNAQASDHRVARRWLDASLSGASTVAFAWVVLLAFIRLSTRLGMFEHPLTLDQATGVVDGWITAPSARILHPSPRHSTVLADLLRETGTAGNLTDDAHLAALAIEHRAQVVSFDADFDRFPGLRWSRPS